MRLRLLGLERGRVQCAHKRPQGPIASRCYIRLSRRYDEGIGSTPSACQGFPARVARTRIYRGAKPVSGTPLGRRQCRASGRDHGGFDRPQFRCDRDGWQRKRSGCKACNKSNSDRHGDQRISRVPGAHDTFIRPLHAGQPCGATDTPRSIILAGLGRADGDAALRKRRPLAHVHARVGDLTRETARCLGSKT